MNTKQLLDAIQEEFDKLTAAKNTWGKNELALLMEKAKVNVLLRLI